MKQKVKANETKIRIASMLNELLKEKDIERVSVVELCQKSNVSRTTFYKYFQEYIRHSPMVMEILFGGLHE